eukprot:scaffold40091_cov60-Phaeocystis_antarctica.AAC.4
MRSALQAIVLPALQTPWPGQPPAHGPLGMHRVERARGEHCGVQEQRPRGAPIGGGGGGGGAEQHGVGAGRVHERWRHGQHDPAAACRGGCWTRPGVRRASCCGRGGCGGRGGRGGI